MVVIIGLAGGIAMAAEPVKLAGTARFDLSADRQAGAIGDGRFLDGDGSLARMNWLAVAEQPRGYTASFPVTYRGWRTTALRFTPAPMAPFR